MNRFGVRRHGVYPGVAAETRPLAQPVLSQSRLSPHSLCIPSISSIAPWSR